MNRLRALFTVWSVSTLWLMLASFWGGKELAYLNGLETDHGIVNGPVETRRR